MGVNEEAEVVAGRDRLIGLLSVSQNTAGGLIY